ncbi:MAG: hypothetical protein EZS28_031394 [Streblomastix strix]|uniref:Uncharacterized protein n=1 Tax=Streblomastix strix TaxID=222440 RepID=A0A5J4URJ5_9EUKA|nr:MAG: hypothetical protein EZS28_031394 [Streblomastix strix]
MRRWFCCFDTRGPSCRKKIYLTIHHAARIIAGDAQQSRELTLVIEQIKEFFGNVCDTYSVLGKLSEDRIYYKSADQRGYITSSCQTDSRKPGNSAINQPKINKSLSAAFKSGLNSSTKQLWKLIEIYQPQIISNGCFLLELLRIREWTVQEKLQLKPSIRQPIIILIPLKQLFSVNKSFITVSTSPGATIPITIGTICT